MKLSDAYLEKTESPMLELTVKIININLPVSHPILGQCRPLYEYSRFIQKIKDHLGNGANRGEAIILAMADCEREGIMTDFLKEHGTEAVNMLFTEFNMEDALDVRYEEGQKDGIQKGQQQGLIKGQQLMLALIKAMMADGRGDELGQLNSDPSFLKEMMDYYQIS